MLNNQLIDQDQLIKLAYDIDSDKVFNKNTLTACINHINQYTLQLLSNTILLTSHRGNTNITKEDLDLAIDYMM